MNNYNLFRAKGFNNYFVAKLHVEECNRSDLNFFLFQIFFDTSLAIISNDRQHVVNGIFGLIQKEMQSD